MTWQIQEKENVQQDQSVMEWCNSKFSDQYSSDQLLIELLKKQHL